MLNLKNLPQNPGVYLFKNNRGEIIYVGKAINLKNRVKSYFQKNLALGEKTKILVENIAGIETIKVDSEIEALLLEANLIQKYKPKYNIDLKDNKSFPYIKITDNDIKKVRKITDDDAQYFGPYTDVKTLELIIKKIRVAFIFKNEKINKKNISLFLQGKKDLLLNKLTKQMNFFANSEDFEKANEIKYQIEKIKNFTKPVIKPFEYLQNPNLLDDQISKSLNDLSKILNIINLQRIECYDVANISGKFSTASMVVFTNGQKDSNSYRRFKIHITGKANDYKMLEETLIRRFNHFEWPKPDLIVIDGGLGHLNVFKNLKINIPAISLAKKEETIYFKNNRIVLDKNSPALKLLQRIRDEAHRFATNYHKKLRLKSLTNPL